VSAETGIKSASIFNSPYDIAMSNETIRVACGYIEKIKSDYLVLSDEGAALFQFKDKPGSLSGGRGLNWPAGANPFFTESFRTWRKTIASMGISPSFLKGPPNGSDISSIRLNVDTLYHQQEHYL
jgi:hypothetical protein